MKDYNESSCETLIFILFLFTSSGLSENGFNHLKETQMIDIIL